jgi:hypothetical protein
VTSRRHGGRDAEAKDGHSRSYHLAYKLVNCKSVPTELSPSHLHGNYAVRGDMENSVHFGFNEATDTLRRLTFASGQPMRNVTNMGLKLLSIPELTTDDIDLMDRYAHKLIHGRSVFLSYAHADSAYVARLERELAKQDIQVRCDRSVLSAGDSFEEALRKEARSADCVMVLISRNTPASEWVRREVDWALAEYRAGGFVKRIVPLLLPGAALDNFPELRDMLHCRQWPRKANAEFFGAVGTDIRGHGGR